MNSRQRVLAALRYEEADRVPIDLGGHRSSGISAIAYSKLRKHLGLQDRPIRVYDMVQQLAVVDEDMLDRFGVDVVELGRGFCLRDEDWKDWILPDGTACQIPYYINVEQRGDNWYLLTDEGTELGVQKKGCLYFEQTRFPLMERGIEADDFSDLDMMIGETIWAGIPHPGAHLRLDNAGLAEMAKGAKALRASTDRAIVGLFGGNMFELPQWLYRMDNFLLYLAMYPEQVDQILEKLFEIHMENLKKWLGAVGPYIDVICFGDDLGGQNCPLLSPQMYRDVFKGLHSRLWRRAKELSDAKVMLHCCGAVSELLEDFIEAGLDAINPVQISCAGMELASLKERFAGRLVFWGGGCDTHAVLPEGTVEEIFRHSKAQAGILKAGGGGVFQQVHNIMANVSPERIVAMFDAVK